MEKTKVHSTAGEEAALQTSLSGIASGAMNEPTRMRRRRPIQPVRGKPRGKGKGKPWTNIRALAKENSAEALEKVMDLMYSDNDCVSFGAARTVLERGHGKVPVIHICSPKDPMPKSEDLRVRIRRFKQEE